MNDTLALFILLFGLPICMVGVFYIYKGTKSRGGRWGMNVNISEIKCPECGHQPRNIRMPRTLRQALWGGGLVVIAERRWINGEKVSSLNSSYERKGV